MEEEKKEAKKGQRNWIKIYPIYLDKNFKYSEGRKTGLLLSIDSPTLDEIFKVCSVNLKLSTKVEFVKFSL